MNGRGHHKAKSVQLHMVAEPYMPLNKLLKITNTSKARFVRLEQQLMEHVRGVADLGLLLLDLHSGNVLVRPSINTSSHRQWGIAAAEAWDSRLTDFDRRMILPVPELSVNCRQLLMLSGLALNIACHPWPRAAFSHEIRRLAALPILQAEPWCAAALGIPRAAVHSNVSRVAPVPSNSGSGGRAIAEFIAHHQTVVGNMLKREKNYGDTDRPYECRGRMFGALRRRWEKGLSPL